MIRPSSLPALAQCPRFDADPGGSEHAAAGTVRHDIFAALLRGEEIGLTDLTEEELDGVQWAVDYVKMHKTDEPLVIEERGSFRDADFETVSGTPDVVCGPDLFDLKWREDDYRLQLAGYVLMQDFDPVRVHIMFAQRQRVLVYTLSQAEADQMLEPVLREARNPAAQPVPNEYCGWCSRRRNCPALIDRVNVILAGRPDWQLERYHPSEINDPDEMGKALRLAKAVAEWAESVEFHAKEMAVKAGRLPSGFRLTTRLGNREVPNIAEAFPLTGLPQGEFLKACKLSLTNLAKLYAAFHGQKEAPAKRDLDAKLAALIQRKPSIQYLTPDKE